METTFIYMDMDIHMYSPFPGEASLGELLLRGGNKLVSQPQEAVYLSYLKEGFVGQQRERAARPSRSFSAPRNSTFEAER